MTDEKDVVVQPPTDTKGRALIPYYVQEKEKSILDSITAKWAMWIITAIVVPITLTSLYTGVSTLEEHSKLLSGMQVTLNDIKNGQDQFNRDLAQLRIDEHADQTDIAVLKSEIERPPPQQQYVPEMHHFRRQHIENPVTDAIDHIFKPITKALKPQPQHRSSGRGG